MATLAMFKGIFIFQNQPTNQKGKQTMKTLITRIKRVALALCFVTPLVSWAGLPTITVNGNDVTISTDSGSHGNIGTSNGGYDTLTIPAATDLDSGTVLLIKSISLGARTSGTAAPASVVLAGVSSAAAEVTTNGYTDRDKCTYVFKTPCLMKVGTGSTISFRNSSGEQVNVGLAASLTGSTDQDDYLFTTLKATSGNNKWSVLTEIVAEKVTGFINETKDGFNTTVTSEKVYVSGVTGYLNTIDAFGFGTVDELVVVDGAYTYGYKVVNGNSPQNNDTKCNRAVAFKKLSGTGTITNGDHGNGPTPVMGVCDSSEFAGSINIGSATTRLSVLFCTEAEISAGIGTSLGANLYSLFTSETGRSRIYVSAGRTTANNAVVTVPSGKTWTAVNGIVNKGELVVDGTVSCNIVNDGTLTVNGTVTGTISGSGTVVVNEGATIASFGSQRDFTGWTVDSSVPVKIAMTAEEYGKGSVSVTGASGISSITVLAPDGTTEVTTLTPENGEAAYERGSVLVSGKACWYDWEMNGNLNGTGANTQGLSHDDGSSDQNAFYNSSMLYTYRHPYTSITFPATWTAVVRCTVPKVVNGTVITFGTKFTSFIGLIAGDDPETEMKLVRYNYNDEAYTVLASMPILDGTSAQHVYIFSVENNSTVKVYCDGSVVLDQTFDAFSLGGGIQIGSAHGGVAGGLVRMWAGDTYAGLTTADLEEARIDCVRLYDYSLSAEQVAALSTEFPSVTIYRATVADKANTTWDDLSWEPSWTGGNSLSKVILTTEGDATVALPETITADQLQFVLAADSTLTLAGPGSLTVTEPVDIGNGTLELTGTVTLTQDTTFNGKVKFTQFTKAGAGAIKLSTGATVGVDAALVVTPLGTYTCAEGTVVDSSYTGAGVKLMPLTSAACSLTSGTTVRYYSDATGVFDTFASEAATDENLVYTILDGTDWSSYAGQLGTLGYYYDQAAGTITRAFARIAAVPYMSLADAVAAATDGATVVLLRASNEEITLNKAITLSETANFSGTLTGNGTLTFAAFRNNPSITFTDWTGTVVLPSFTAGGTIFNKYGVTGSTVVLKGIDSGWLGETGTQRMDVEPTLQLDGNVTITGFSTSWDYTFAEITGTGTFSLDPTDNNPMSATITKVAEGFTGTVYTDIDTTLTIGTLARKAGTSTEPDTLLLSTDGEGDVAVGAVTIGGEPVDVRLETREDGIYVGAVAYVGETPYATLADAVGAATDGATVTLVANVTLAARVEPNKTMTIDLNGKTITRVGPNAGNNGSAFRVTGGNVTIKNGTIDCTQSDADVVANGVYAIDVKGTGASLVLEDMTITVNSQAGACVYPFAGTTVTIKSGTYRNNTAEEYQYKTGWTGMAVNQANVTDQLITITGGSFWQVNPAEGDDSGLCKSFLAEGYESNLVEGYWVVTEKQGIDPESVDPQPLDVDPDAGETAAQEAAEAQVVTVTTEVANVLKTAEVSADTYQGYFTKTAVRNVADTAWLVKTEIRADIVEDVNEDAVTELTEAIADTTAETVTVTKIPVGLYYKVESLNALGGDAIDFATGLSGVGGAPTVDKPTADGQGFIRVTLSASSLED